MDDTREKAYAYLGRELGGRQSRLVPAMKPDGQKSGTEAEYAYTAQLLIYWYSA